MITTATQTTGPTAGSLTGQAITTPGSSEEAATTAGSTMSGQAQSPTVEGEQNQKIRTITIYILKRGQQQAR